MSDWGGVHSTVKAANAGLDQQSGQELDHAMYFGAPLKQAVETGAVPMALLDGVVRTILTGIIENALWHPPMTSDAHPHDRHDKAQATIAPTERTRKARER